MTPDQAKMAHIEVSVAEDRDVGDLLATPGRIAADEAHVGHVFSPVTGRILGIHAQVGEHVRKGAPLATIESPDLGDALSDMNKAQADLIAAEHDVKRQKALREERATSEAVVERSVDNWRRAKAEVERARQKANLLHSGHVDSVTQTYTLTSPIDGEVLARNINPGIEIQGQYAGGGAQELFTVGDLEQVWAIADLYESDLARVRTGAAMAVTVLAHGDRVFSGTVDWVSGTLDPTTRTARVKCVLDNRDHALRPEMYATMQVSVDPRRVLAIPRNALVQLGEYKVVFVEEAQVDARVRFSRVPVEVDVGAPGAWLPVVRGVEAGQRVVVGGAALLQQRL
jgi:cobalt-zinc-cadmium efflux system membrane fusion protein